MRPGTALLLVTCCLLASGGRCKRGRKRKMMQQAGLSQQLQAPAPPDTDRFSAIINPMVGAAANSGAQTKRLIRARRMTGRGSYRVWVRRAPHDQSD